MTKIKVIALSSLFICLLGTTLSAEVHDLKKAEKEIRIDEHYGEKINLNTTFYNEKGEKVPLRQFFQTSEPTGNQNC